MGTKYYHLYDYDKYGDMQYEDSLLLCGIPVSGSVYKYLDWHIRGSEHLCRTIDNHSLCPECKKHVVLRKLMEL